MKHRLQRYIGRRGHLAQEAVGQDAAFEEGLELVLHELRQIGPGGIFGLGEEGGGVLLHRPTN